MSGERTGVTHGRFVIAATLAGGSCGGLCSVLFAGSVADLFAPGLLFAVLTVCILSLATSYGAVKCLLVGSVVMFSYPLAYLSAFAAATVAGGYFSGLVGGLAGGVCVASATAFTLTDLPDRFFKIGLMTGASGLIGGLGLPAAFILMSDPDTYPGSGLSCLFVPWQAGIGALIAHWGLLDREHVRLFRGQQLEGE